MRIARRAMIAGGVAAAVGIPAAALAVTDTTPPTLTGTPTAAAGITGPVSELGANYFSGLTRLPLAASDPSKVARITCAFDGNAAANVATGPANTLNFTAQFATTLLGKRTYSCTATDTVGNTTAPLAGEFRIDPRAPAGIHTVSPGGISNGPITVTVGGLDEAVGSDQRAVPGAGVKRIGALVDGVANVTNFGTYMDYASTSYTFSTEGSHTVVYRVTDNVNNRNDEKSVTVYIDKTSPTGTYTGAALVTVGRQAGDAGAPTLSGTAGDDKNLESVNVRFRSLGTSDASFDQTFTATCARCGLSGTGAWSLDLSAVSPRPPAGTYETTIRVRDAAGNVTVIDGPTVRFL